MAQLAAAAAFAVPVRAQVPAGAAVPADSQVRRILHDRIDLQRRGVGMVVGVVAPATRFVVTHGVHGIADPRPVTGETIFEIGSVTKVLTASLLADMIKTGDVRLTDTLDRFLPPGLASASGTARNTITLLDLATHTAGLPFWPTNLPPAADNNQALALYTEDQLYEFVRAFTPPDVGVRWRYSNVDAGLLGNLLGRRAGSSYEAALARRVTGPLRMTSTAVRPSPEMSARLASGHDPQLRAAPRWNVPALAGGGALHSTANDLMRFLEALNDSTSVAGAGLTTVLAVRRQAPGFQQAIGWMVLARASDEIIFHDGQTLGFASSIAYDPKNRIGVVVLSNAAIPVGDIARHLLRPAIPLSTPSPPAPQRTAITVDSRLLDLYAGVYEPGPGRIFKVAREREELSLEIPGLPRLRLLPESERTFFVADNTRITVVFERGANGVVTGLVLKAPTGDVLATRKTP